MRLIDISEYNLKNGIIQWVEYEEHSISLHSKMLHEIPTVDAVPVKHGRWIHLEQSEYATISGKCTCCGWEAHYYEDDVANMPYCPNCGAKMDLEEQDAAD